MGFLRKQLLKVIKWEGGSNDQIVYKYEYDDRYAIMKGSELIVMPSQAAIFVYRGQVADVFTEGSWKLEDGSTPILTQIANWKYAFENPKDVVIYFVSLKRFSALKWGTPNPIMMRDKDFGMIRISGNGTYAFHVMNPELFMKECFGTIRSFKTEDIEEHLKALVIAELTDLLGECEIPALNLAANYLELGDTTRNNVARRFREIGLDVDNVTIRTLKLPEDVEKAMDKRTSVGIFKGSMNEFAQYESINAIGDAAKNQGLGGGMAAMGIGLGAGQRMAGTFAAGLNGATTPQTKCPKCGASVAADAKFCPECGQKIGEGEVIACPKCGKTIPANTKFCPECGSEIKSACPKCGQQVKPGTKFCPNCGSKIK